MTLMHDARNDPHFSERIGDSSMAGTAWDRERDQAPHALLASRQLRTGRPACFSVLAAQADHTQNRRIAVVFVDSFSINTFQ